MSDKNPEKGEVSRRDFLGLAAIGTAVLSALGVLAGVLRIFKPDVHFEESKKFKIGKPEQFPVGTVKKFDDKKLFVFSDEDGFYAITAVCQHLGCIVYKTDWGFQCPCHGSKYDQMGNVIGGPAPRGLPWFKIEQLVDGSLVVDASKEVPKGTKYIYV
ncbi:MAG TPA: ubiquinol-cytochrome c reductase iron-sulfur subunit [Nitrospirae bacterium]|nr:ubiquinol-cytochrome c reductase iron-sulfur subunit [Nitrospirota bacterium]